MLIETDKRGLNMALQASKNIRLFKNPILEQFTYVHPIMPALVWLPVSAFSFYRGLHIYNISLSSSVSLLIFGALFWTFAEYVLHRFVFHFKPRNAFQERLLYLMHEVHHDDPNDQRRLLMPPIAAILIAAILWGIFVIFLGRAYINPFFSGFLIGYLVYDYTHFATHFWRIKGGMFQTLKKNHMDHHFKSPDTLYGVSSPFWDYVFNTFSKGK